MKFLPLLWRNLMRKKVRTIFTGLSILVSFLLFGLLGALESAFSQGAGLAGVDRLVTMHKVSFIQPLPLRYRSKIESVDGVEVVGHQTWFGGYYQELTNRFSQFAVDPEAHLALTPELALSDAEKEAWLANRTGAIVARSLADRYGWQLGDRIPLKPTIFERRDGSAWEFTIEGIIDDSVPSSSATSFLLHYEYLREGFGSPGAEFNFVQQYISRISDPARATEIAAEIDRHFANSETETKTSTEKVFAQSFANQVGNIRAIALGITAIVFFTLLLVAGNTVAQSVRERTDEFAVLKTCGFTDGAVMGLVLAEALILAGLGGGAGLALAWLAAGSIDIQEGLLGRLYVPTQRLVTGAGLIALFGVAAAALPAWQALRLRIVDALRSA
ncbi:MAG: FtsX-like permease family protein [Myxococcota bacterium]